MPLSMHAERADVEWKKAAGFLSRRGSSFNMIHEIAKPLLDLDLGGTMLLPMRILLADKKSGVFAGRRYYHIPRVHLLEALDPEKSRRLRKSRYTPESAMRILPSEHDVKDDEIVLDARTLAAPAIWHDETLMSSKFFSDAAVQALKAAGVDHHFQFVRCPIVRVY